MQEPVGSDLLLDSESSKLETFRLPLSSRRRFSSFKIAVEDAARMAKSDGGDELLKILLAEIFGESAFSDLWE